MDVSYCFRFADFRLPCQTSGLRPAGAKIIDQRRILSRIHRMPECEFHPVPRPIQPFLLQCFATVLKTRHSHNKLSSD